MLDNTLKDNLPIDDTRTGNAQANNLQVLPIRYWWITVAMVVFFVGAISGWYRVFQAQVDIPPATEYNIERLTAPTEGLRVVAIGNSLIRFGLPFDERFDKMALEQGLSLKLTRFTKNGGENRHFSLLLPYILAARPDFVIFVVEPFLMNPIRRSSSLLAPFRKGIRNIKKKIEGRKSVRLFIENSEGGVDTKGDWTTKPEMVENRIKEMKKRTIADTSKTSQAYEEFFKSARDQGTRVILLDLGHPREVNEAFSPEFRNKITARLAELEARYPIEVWRFPSNLPLTHYKDIFHLNIKGQRVFANWLIDRLKDEVKIND